MLLKTRVLSQNRRHRLSRNAVCASLFLLSNLCHPGYYSLRKKWRFSVPLKNGIDTLTLAHYTKKNQIL